MRGVSNKHCLLTFFIFCKGHPFIAKETVKADGQSVCFHLTTDLTNFNCKRWPACCLYLASLNGHSRGWHDNLSPFRIHDFLL